MANSKKWMAWVGTNATTGTPHKLTGLCSRWGDIHLFKSKAERDSFCDEWNSRYQVYPVPTNKREAKAKYFAGMSQRAYEVYLEILEYETED